MRNNETYKGKEIDIHNALTLLQFIIFSSKLNQTCARIPEYHLSWYISLGDINYKRAIRK